METFDKLIIQSGFIPKIFHQLPLYALILDEKRQIVFSNDYFLIENEIKNSHEVFGKGPGDVFQCENAEEAGCGNSSNCTVCGIFKTLKECMEKKALISSTCKLMVNRSGFVKAYDFKVKCSPLILNEDTFYLLTLTDVSAESRIRNLERIFFHDVLNMINGLSGFSYLIKETSNQADIQKFVSIISSISEMLGETIMAQSDLINAENKELKVNVKKVLASVVIESVVESIIFKSKPYENHVIIKELKTDFIFHTDLVLLTRILINMVKNAAEAPNSNNVITIGCFLLNGKASFYVHNHAYIEESAAKSIFKPMFSTKGSTRGLGTYSMRLIGENYLKGKVKFETSQESGTIFTIEIPIMIEV